MKPDDGQDAPARDAGRSDDRREHKLPVTAEVGSEGGSYADPTIQVPTFHTDLPRTDETVSDAGAMMPADPEPAPRMRRDAGEEA